MRDRQMKVGVWLYALGTVLTGVLNITWGAFDASHQPIKSLGLNPFSQQMLAYVAGIWLVAAGLAIVWRRSTRIGAAACAIAYLIFAVLSLPRYSAGIHAFGLRISVIVGITFGLAQQLMLISPAIIVYTIASPDSLLQKRAGVIARWLLGLPPVIFGLFHLTSIHTFAKIVPHWMSFGNFWAVLTGMAFILAGCAIFSGIMDVLAARLLALMLLLFEGFVEIPPIFFRSHNQPTWGAAVYNISAIGACWIFAEFLTSRANRERTNRAENAAVSQPDPLAA